MKQWDLDGLEVVGLVKRVQRGSLTIAAGNGTGTVTILAVDTDNAVVMMLGAIENNASADPSAFLPDVELTAATTVRGKVGSVAAANITISYEVWEFWPGVLRLVQRGTINTAGAGSATATILPVVMNRALVLFGGAYTTFATGQANTILGLIALTDAVTVTLTQPGAITFVMPFTVVELH